MNQIFNFSNPLEMKEILKQIQKDANNYPGDSAEYNAFKAGAISQNNKVIDEIIKKINLYISIGIVSENSAANYIEYLESLKI